jgi:phage tail-like protein
MSDRAADPYRSHRFEVDLGDDRAPLGFAEVSGLSVRVRSRRDGEADGRPPERPNWRRRVGGIVAGSAALRRPRLVSPRLRLRRGLTDDRRLWDWLDDWPDGAATPRCVRVFVLDDAGERGRGWRCLSARPVRWRGPDLSADRAAIATETLELAHDGIEAIDASR